MSDILFQAQDDVAALTAAERARAATLVDDLALGLLGPHRTVVARRLYGLLGPDHFLRTVEVDTPAWVEGYRAAFTSHVDAGLIRSADRTIDTFALALNTAVLVGNDVIRLLAWLHAECEAHGYLEPEHLGWAADLVEEGRATGLLRSGANWDGVVALLRRAPGPVVLSVAGHGSFPPDATSDDEGDAPWRDQRAASPAPGRPAAGWEPAVARLRADPSVLALNPTTIRQPYGHGLTVLDLIAPDWERRLAS